MKRMSAFVAGVALAVAACGSDGDVPVAGAPGPVDSSGTSASTTIAPSEDGRGWIDGEPKWRTADVDEALSYAAEGESADVRDGRRRLS